MSITLYRKAHLALLSVALITAGVPTRQLRWAREGKSWMIRIPRTRVANAVLVGFLAGHRNKLGYMLGVPARRWEKDFPK